MRRKPVAVGHQRSGLAADAVGNQCPPSASPNIQLLDDTGIDPGLNPFSGTLKISPIGLSKLPNHLRAAYDEQGK